MRLAILDPENQDIGLKILYPHADYYIINEDKDYGYCRKRSYNHYNITVHNDISKINSSNYDILFIILRVKDTVIETADFYLHMDKINNILNENSFKKVIIFDNDDYDYDPNVYFKNSKVNLFLKRNYNKNKIYKDNVILFPFIMFGLVSIIEKIDRDLQTEEQYFNMENKNDRLYFSGNLFNHIDEKMGVYRNRRKQYEQFASYISTSGFVYNEWYIEYMRKSKFSLDLIGVGDPNIRTFEILVSGSLMLSFYNDLKWPFEEEFSEYTKFKTIEEFKEKYYILQNNIDIYNEALRTQYNIVKKYFNLNWLREYINKLIDS
jgi:hypothetical protein